MNTKIHSGSGDSDFLTYNDESQRVITIKLQWRGLAIGDIPESAHSLLLVGDHGVSRKGLSSHEEGGGNEGKLHDVMLGLYW